MYHCRPENFGFSGKNLNFNKVQVLFLSVTTYSANVIRVLQCMAFIFQDPPYPPEKFVLRDFGVYC
jgi:hypothetical protein